jgi:DNA anti-recombination protein RmuC
LLRQLAAEVDYLKQIVAHDPARGAIGQVALDDQLLTQFE